MRIRPNPRRLVKTAGVTLLGIALAAFLVDLRAQEEPDPADLPQPNWSNYGTPVPAARLRRSRSATPQFPDHLPQIRIRTYQVQRVAMTRSGLLYTLEDDAGERPLVGRIILLKDQDGPVMAVRVLKRYAGKKQFVARKVRRYGKHEELQRGVWYQAYEKLTELPPPPPSTADDLHAIDELEEMAPGDDLDVYHEEPVGFDNGPEALDPEPLAEPDVPLDDADLEDPGFDAGIEDQTLEDTGLDDADLEELPEQVEEAPETETFPEDIEGAPTDADAELSLDDELNALDELERGVDEAPSEEPVEESPEDLEESVEEPTEELTLEEGPAEDLAEGAVQMELQDGDLEFPAEEEETVAETETETIDDEITRDIASVISEVEPIERTRHSLMLETSAIRNAAPPDANAPAWSYFGGVGLRYGYVLKRMLMRSSASIQDSLTLEGGVYLTKILNYSEEFSTGDAFVVTPLIGTLRYTLLFGENLGMFVYAGGVRNQVISAANDSNNYASRLTTNLPAAGAGLIFRIAPQWDARVDLGIDMLGAGLMLRF